MIFNETELEGAYLVAPQMHADDRGFFARIWCQREFTDAGLTAHLSQLNISHNLKRGTLRGMHYQAWPYREAKLVRCTRGVIFDVIVDLRPDSKTFKRWIGVELSAANYISLYVPEGFAHGFQTIEDDTEVAYYMSEFHEPGSERGFRHDDGAFSIKWPSTVEVISAKDLSWPDFE